jgi:hypothetical protein
MTTAGVSQLTASIPQFTVLTRLCGAKTAFSDLAKGTEMDEATLGVIVKLLCDAKMVLAQGYANGDWSNATLSVNPKFCAKKMAIADNWTPKVVKIKDLSQMRFLAAEACMVRIMKGSRMMKTQQLIERMIKETSPLFAVTLDDIKRCMNYLISQGYIQRSDDEHVMYVE